MSSAVFKYDWLYLDFNQEFQFDGFPDLTILLYDTVISPH